jgi:hypothetical protein
MLIAFSTSLYDMITSGVSACRGGNNVPSRHSLKAQMSKSETWLQGGTVGAEIIGATKLPIPVATIWRENRTIKGECRVE